MEEHYPPPNVASTFIGKTYDCRKKNIRENLKKNYDAVKRENDKKDAGEKS